MLPPDWQADSYHMPNKDLIFAQGIVLAETDPEGDQKLYAPLHFAHLLPENTPIQRFGNPGHFTLQIDIRAGYIYNFSGI